MINHSQLPPTTRDQFAAQGFAVFPSNLPEGVLDGLCAEFHSLAGELPREGYALRGALLKSPAVQAVADRLSGFATSLLGGTAFPTKATFFDKTPEANWVVPWHQDLTITVNTKAETPGCSHWRQHDNIWHVQPPESVLDNTVALRLHLDACPAQNGPLRLIPGSHRHGILSQTERDRIVSESQEVLAITNRGDVLALSPLILHASNKSTTPGHRRVLHVEFSHLPLPEPLQWCESSS